MYIKKLTSKEIWETVFAFPEDTTVSLKILVSPLLFSFFLYAWIGGVGEEIS